MRDSIKLCYTVTKDLYEKTKINDDYSDEQYNEIVLLLTQREEVLSTLIPPFTEQENLLGAEIVKLNKEMEQHLNSIKNQIAEKIKHLNKKGKSINRYTPFNQSGYGYFYDKKN